MRRAPGRSLSRFAVAGALLLIPCALGAQGRLNNGRPPAPTIEPAKPRIEEVALPRGTHFKSRPGSLVAAIDSDRTVDLLIHATPRSVQMFFVPVETTDAAGEAGEPDVALSPSNQNPTARPGGGTDAPIVPLHMTLSGLTPEGTYYLYFDDLQNVQVIAADTEGRYEFDLELRKPRLVILQANPSTFHLHNDGTGCNLIGTFNAATLTCTLNRDVRQSIEIEDDDMTLDGGGFTLDGTGPLFGAAGVFVRQRKNVTVRNVVIDKADTGVTVSGSSDCLFENITIQNGSGGFMELFETPGADTGRNTFQNNEVSVVCPPGVPCGFGLQGIFNNESRVIGNHFVDTKFGVTSLFSVKMQIENNLFEDNPTGISVTSSLSPVTVTGNDITGSSVGMVISAAVGCSITGNVVDGSTEVGLRIPSLSCDITDNTFANGTLGMDLNGSQMTLFHNRFVSNTTQLILGPNANGNNFTGASPLGGNFWSDFDEDAEGCVDGDANGFCDAPYVLNLGSDPEPWAADSGWLDGIPPTTTASYEGTLGNNGWYLSDVTATLTAADDAGGTGVLLTEYLINGFGPTPGSSGIVISTSAGNLFSFRSTDRAGNAEAQQYATISIDKEPPDLVPSRFGPPNAAGWNNSDAAIVWSCSDFPSGVDVCPDATFVTEETDGQDVTVTATDLAGNSTSVTVTVRLDKTPPELVGTPTVEANPAGWHNAAFDVQWTCSDDLSGIATCPDDDHFTSEGDSQYAEGRAFDVAGNETRVFVTPIKIDLTAPSISGAADRAPNGAGWYNAPVDVNFTCSDPLSGIATCATPVTVSTEGDDQPVSGTATDVAGNVGSTTTYVDLDATGPVVGFAGGCGTTAKLNESLSTTVLVSDALSGVASQSVPNGPYTLPTGAFGLASVTVLATDLAGNPGSGTCNYRVGYDFAGGGGFNAPVNNPPVVNIAKAGSTIPVKWRIPDGLGGYLSDLSIVTSIQAQEVSCNDLDETLSDPVETTTTDPAGLRFDGDSNQYHYNWKTQSAWSGRCFLLQLNLDDLSTHDALVKFKN
ncbi:MAG TPA: PxKF domain-containing protein [Candidatus Polarisedimenticolia bacterium]|nr:PxKF domain-containing protein [Candidatus Polarisedimenticolia bacterium]